MERCTSCGAELPGAAQFCGYCGHLVISLREMPTKMIGSPTINMLEDDVPTSISGPSRTLLSSGERRDSTIAHTPPEAATLQRMPLSHKEKEADEEDCVLFGLPLPASQAPVVDTPTVQSTPVGPYARTPSPLTPALERNTPLPQVPLPLTPLPQMDSWLPSHAAAPPTNPSSPYNHPVTQSGSSRPGHTSSGVLIALIVAIICMLITGIIGGLFFGAMPAMSLAGSSNVTAGEGLHLHGYRFFPGSSITLTLDDRLQLFSTTGSATAGQVRNSSTLATAFPLTAAGQLASSKTGIKADGSGSFDVTIPVNPLWGLGPHSLRATESFPSRSVLLNFTIIAAPAKILVQPSTLDFGKLEVGSKAVMSLVVNNPGGQPLNWQVTAGSAAWLKFAPAAGTLQAGASPQFIYVTADTNQLKVETYSATLTISSNGGSAKVDVRLQVIPQRPQPQPCVLQAPSSSNETFNTNMDSNPGAQTFTIAVSGSCSSGVTITPNVTMASGTGWLAVTPSSATITSGSATFTVKVTSSALAPGSYSGAISLTAAAGNTVIKHSPQTVAVALTVTEVPPVLAVSPTALSYSLTNGDSTTAKGFTISNTGGAALNWTAALDANAPSFVSLSLSSGKGLAAGASTSVAVNVDPSAQTAGTYVATVTVNAIDPITGQSVKGSPAAVSVKITITAQPSMQVSPTSLDFTPGNCVYTASGTVTITNTGGGTLTWTAADPVYGSNQPAGWLTVTSASGSDGAGVSSSLQFSVEGSGSQLVSGQTYTATVTITPSVGKPQDVSLSFTKPPC